MSPFAESNIGEKFLFQNDGASIHRINHTSYWIDCNELYVLKWREIAVLGHYKKVWVLLALKVDKNQLQSQNIEYPDVCTIYEWKSMTNTVRKNLISILLSSSMELV